MTDTAESRSWTITNVRVFDGHTLSGPRTILVKDGLIVEDANGGTVVDGGGATLLPGLIDAHVHVDAAESLGAFAQWGVTTALDMGAQPKALVDRLRNKTGVTDIRSAGSPASGPGSAQTTKAGFDPSTALRGPDEAERFIADRVREGSDYVKIIVENPADKTALSQDTIAAVVTAAHARGLQTIAHAASTAAYQIAIDAGVDVLTHAPLNADLSGGQIQAIVSRGIKVIPTLTMMDGIAGKVGMPTSGDGPGYRHAEAAVGAMHTAGIPVIAGTDANNAPFVPYSPVHGESIHGELALLVAAGLTPAEALRAATSRAAELFGLDDRGAITPGLRADLLLVEGDPTTDISATRNIRHVWIAGQRIV
jgi:imidazolonepropionase-like amidohydrolase